MPTESPRSRRLRADYEKIQNLIRNSNLIHLDRVDGDPPENYEIRFTCKGVTNITSEGVPLIGEIHKVRIELHKEYPIKAPHLRWLTEIFHPNFKGYEVCINSRSWSPEQRLDDLIIMLGRMIQFQVHNVGSPYNGSAARWTEEHLANLPIDNRPLLRGIIDRDNVNSPVIKIHVK